MHVMMEPLKDMLQYAQLRWSHLMHLRIHYLLSSSWPSMLTTNAEKCFRWIPWLPPVAMTFVPVQEIEGGNFSMAMHVLAIDGDLIETDLWLERHI
jgi:hypothetical protein